jgi:nucleotide-binding universal stress UspA family protein
MLPVKKIIVTTDFSQPSLSGVNAAVELAQIFDADLLLAHVTQPLQTVSGATTMAGYHLPSVEKEINAEVSQLADQLMEKEIPASMGSEVRILSGRPANAIAELAEKENADLIVIASKGDSAWKQAVLGSVAEGVVRHATCPVMAVPAA